MGLNSSCYLFLLRRTFRPNGHLWVSWIFLLWITMPVMAVADELNALSLKQPRAIYNINKKTCQMHISHPEVMVQTYYQAQAQLLLLEWGGGDLAQKLRYGRLRAQQFEQQHLRPLYGMSGKGPQSWQQTEDAIGLKALSLLKEKYLVAAEKLKISSSVYRKIIQDLQQEKLAPLVLLPQEVDESWPKFLEKEKIAKPIKQQALLLNSPLNSQKQELNLYELLGTVLSIERNTSKVYRSIAHCYKHFAQVIVNTTKPYNHLGFAPSLDPQMPEPAKKEIMIY